MKLPNKKDLSALFKRLKRQMLENPHLYWNVVTEQYECEVTIGCDGTSKEFGYQTGDNSYTGACYGFPHWAIVTITNHSNIKDLVNDCINQFSELVQQ